MTARTISVVTLVDVAGALASGTLSNNLYLMDNNKTNGSSDEGTEILKTRVRAGDQLLWTTVSLEPEAYASITGILIDSDYCEPEQRSYAGSDVTYWIGKVKKNLDLVPYKLEIKVGTQNKAMVTVSSPSLVGQ